MSCRNEERTTRSTISRRRRHGGTIINVLTGVILLGLLAAGVFWVIKTAGEASSQYTTAVVDAKRNATTLACQMNLRSIAQCLQAYAVGGEGFPASREEFASACGSSKVLRCPDPCGVDYVYIPGARGDMPATTVLVYEAKPVHEGRCNVLFLDGRIDAITPDRLQLFLDATLAERRR